MATSGGLFSTPPGLRPSRGIVGIHRLAEAEPPSLGPAHYQLYVIEVLDPREQTPYEYYVGVTKESPEKRLAAHSRGGLYAASIFKKDSVRPGALRTDLSEGLPRFRCRSCAKNAEGRLARVIAAQLGPTYSDQVNNRVKGAVAPCAGRGE